MARSPIFDNVDPELLALIQQVARNYGPYGVNITSAYRAGDPRQHGRGNALDVQLYDRDTGAALPNYQDASQAGAYQQLANAIYQAASPEMRQRLRWGGYFGGGKGKYGALDLMHFDVAGGPGGIPMAGGSWEGGFNPGMMKTWGIQNAGGLGGGGGTDSMLGSGGADSLDPQQQWMAGLWQHALAASQKTGIDPRLIMAQTALETGYGKSAPNNAYFGIKGKGSTQKTLEYINGRMTPVQADFRAYASPQESFEDWANLMMGSRYAGVREAKGLQAQIEAMAKSGYATDPDYAAKLLSIAQGIPEGGFGTGANTGATTQSPTTAGAPAPDGAPGKDKESPWKSIASNIGSMFGGGSGAAATQQPTPMARPTATAMETPYSSVLDPAALQGQRDRLAMAMARLNSGKWG